MKERKANGTKVKGRANGCGTLEKRGHIYRAKWVVNGKVFTKTTGTGDRREAEKKLAEFVAPTQAASDKERLENIQARIAGREAEIKRFEDKKPALALADAYAAYGRYLDAPDNPKRKARAVTLDRYEAQYNQLVAWVKKKYPEAVEFRQFSEDMARSFLADLQTRASANTYNKRLTLYKRMWKVLAKVARVEGGNPWGAFQNREEDESIRRELTTAELKTLGNHVEGETARLFAIGIYTGLRLWDAITLDWETVDLKKNHITVHPSKTTKYDDNGTAITPPVIIPIVPAFRKILLSIPEAERTGAVCPTLAEQYRHNASNTSKKIQQVFTACGIETHEGKGKGGRARVTVGFHSFRHTFVTIAAECGIPLATVQAIVGHTAPAMTQHYTHVREEAAQSHMLAFPDVFSMPTGGNAVAALTDYNVIDVEAVETSATVELDAETLAAVDAIRKGGESRIDVIRRAVKKLAKDKK